MKLFKKNTKIEEISDGRAQQDIERKSIIVHHYCPHTYNAGDHFVIRSIRKHLSMFLPEAIYIPKPCANNRGWGRPVRLTGPNVNFSNRYADAVIIGGSDQYNNWSLRLKPDEMKKLIPPLYLIGLGATSKEINGKVHIEKKSYYEDIRFANETARMSSVRDRFTQAFLESCGFNKSVLTGCPAMYLYNQPFELKSGGKAALTFPFPVLRSRKSPDHERLISSMQRIYQTVSDLGFEPVIACHDDRDVRVAQTVFPENTLFFANDVDMFLKFYEDISLVVGSRLHACILATGMGIPFVNINLDARGKAFSDTFGLTDWNLNINDPGLFEKIDERITLIHQNKLETFHSLQKTRDTYYQIFLTFMKDAAEDIRRQLPVQGHPS